MSVRLNRLSYEHAQKLIKNRQCVLDDPEHWHDHRPSPHAQKRVVQERGTAHFAIWHLGEDDEQSEGSRHRYSFPYGDFRNVHRCAVLAAQARASQDGYPDIEAAAAHLHAMLDALMSVAAKEHGRVPSL